MMKRYFNFYTIFLSLMVVAGTIFFFQYRQKPTPIPPLRERQGPISTTSEWLNTKAAIQGLQRKLRDKPGDMQSKLFLALAYMQEARITGEHPYYYPAALTLIDDILDQRPDNPALLFEATVAKASIQLSLHQFENALKTGNQALKINPKTASVYGVLCDANVELGNYEEAIKMADRMTGLRPDLKSYARVSYLREIHGDMPGAIEAMKLAAGAGYPGLEQTSWTKVTLGNLYEKTGDLKNAEIWYQQALNEYPNYAFALGGLGRIAVKKNDHQNAISLFTKAATVLPEFSFQEELTRLYQLKGQETKAKETLKDLLVGLEEDQEAGHVVDLELAQIHLELKKDPEQALQYAKKEYKRRPDNIDVCRVLANIYYHQKDFKRAAVLLQKANRTNSQEASLICLNGLVQYRLGNLASGENLIRRSLSLNPFQNDANSTEGKSLLSRTVSKI